MYKTGNYRNALSRFYRGLSIVPAVETRLDTDCWMTALRGRKPRRKFKLYGKSRLPMYIAALLLLEGRLSGVKHKLLVHHLCKNPRCCNPRHLVIICKDLHTLVHVLEKLPPEREPADAYIKRHFCPRTDCPAKTSQHIPGWLMPDFPCMKNCVEPYLGKYVPFTGQSWRGGRSRYTYKPYHFRKPKKLRLRRR